MADGEKTEKATPKKRRDERKKGNIFFSNDVVSVAVLGVCMAMIAITASTIAAEAGQFLRQCISMAGAPEQQAFGGGLKKLFEDFVWATVRAVGPLMAIGTLTGIAITLFQTKLLVTGESLKPKFSRINPLQGVKRLFSLRSLVDVVKNLLKIILLFYLIYNFLAGIIDTLPKLLFTDIGSGCAYLLSLAMQISVQITIAYAILAAADVFYQRWDYERGMRMSKQEIKEEFKQMEGDPKIKGKIKEMQRRMAQSRMMQQVPEADVVIRNPTHYAVALRYKPDKDTAPVVLAKGQDSLALRIVKIAEESKVAVVENVPLARALYGSTEVGDQIPPELYNAVAEVLVYLYRLNQGKT